MVERALDSEVERDLQAVFTRSGDQTAKILRRAQRGMNRIVPTLDAADGIGTAGIIGAGLEGVVATLAVGRADRMDRREKGGGEAHGAGGRDGLGVGGERSGG